MRLSENFTLAELIESQTARRHNISEQFNPPQSVINNLTATVEHILQPLRTAVGAPIRVSSGYRHRRVNTIIGGSANSQHIPGQAIDFSGIGMSNAELFQRIRQMRLPFDQLIWEYGTATEPAWIHVSYSPRHRRQVLYIPATLSPKS